MATASLQKAFANQFSMLLAVETCALVLSYNTCYDWKKYNQIQLGKEKKLPSPIYFATFCHTTRHNCVSHVFALIWEWIVLYKKKKKTCKLNKLKSWNFRLKILRNSHNAEFWAHSLLKKKEHNYGSPDSGMQRHYLKFSCCTFVCW